MNPTRSLLKEGTKPVRSDLDKIPHQHKHNSQPKTAPLPKSGRALGLKYTLVMRGHADIEFPSEVEVASETVFHSGDKVQVKIEANDYVHVYIFAQGSSGAWDIKVPSERVAERDKRLEPMRADYFPSKTQIFALDERAGVERLFVMASRRRLTNLEDEICRLQSQSEAGEQAGRLHQCHSSGANVDIPDDRIARLDAIYSRDLIIESLPPDSTESTDPARDFATYVVNPTGSPDSRLVAKISIEHK